MAFTPATFRRATIAVTGTAVALGALPVAAAATPSPVSHAQVSSTKADRAKLKRIAARERANRKRASLVRVALNQKGERYVAGASGPNRFDCSGFTMYVYKKATGRYLPHYSGAQMRKAKRVSRKNLKPGDLLFFGPGGSQHVSMYIGKGKMIHATNPRSGVRIDSINMGYYKARYAGAGRIIQG
ncbi:MAG: C40 family peptidase [Candidatus Nanopelagicales bacterium]